MSEATFWISPSSRRSRRLTGDDDGGELLIPERKAASFSLITKHRSFNEITIDYPSVIDAKSSRRSAPEARPELPKENTPAPEGHSGWLHDWDVWDVLVVIGFILLVVGLIVPLVSNRREASVVAPLGAAAVGFGAFRSRQKNNPLT